MRVSNSTVTRSDAFFEGLCDSIHSIQGIFHWEKSFLKEPLDPFGTSSGVTLVTGNGD